MAGDQEMREASGAARNEDSPGESSLGQASEDIRTEPRSSVPGTSPSSNVHQFCTETLKMYYRWLFPFKEMHSWLSYGNDKKTPGSDQGESFFRRREFSFTLENDIYIRFQSFKDTADMEEQIIKKCPHKIDIGAVYSVDPKMKSALQGGDHFTPVERELVFDVDMTDYDDIRTCCTGAAVCDRCWTLMTVAIKVVDRTLRDDFGFEQLLWVFSGRRGVHCWVCDSRARRLTDEQRGAITEYFRVYKGSEGNSKKVNFTGNGLHPALWRAYDDVLLPYFETKIVTDQLLLENEPAWTKFLENVPLEELRQRLGDKWRSDRRGNSADASLLRWKELHATLQSERKLASRGMKEKDSLKWAAEEIVFGYAYPRLDLEVSKHMNHLLKAPFCVHPKTGKVCVPINPATCDSFSPNSVPTLSQLMEELNNCGEADQKTAEGTSLQEYIVNFRETFLTGLTASCREELQARHKQMLKEKGSGVAW